MGITPQEERMREYTACFTGHRQLNEAELPALVMRLDRVLNALYQAGYRRFMCGGARGFDLLAAEAVVRLKERHSNVQLICVIPHAYQANSMSPENLRRYQLMVIHADRNVVLSPFYYKGCMQVRNRYMVDRSSFCLCLLEHVESGGTVSTVVYATQQDVPVLNLMMPEACDDFCRQHPISEA